MEIDEFTISTILRELQSQSISNPFGCSFNHVLMKNELQDLDFVVLAIELSKRKLINIHKGYSEVNLQNYSEITFENLELIVSITDFGLRYLKQNNVIKRKDSRMNLNTSIFIGSSKEAERAGILHRVAISIEKKGFEPLAWNQSGLFVAGDIILPKLIDISKSVKGAILIFSEDDKTWYRNDLTFQPRDNVIFEFGLFVGAIGHKNAIICKYGATRIPTDLGGLVFIDLEKKYESELGLFQWLENL